MTLIRFLSFIFKRPHLILFSIETWIIYLLVDFNISKKKFSHWRDWLISKDVAYKKTIKPTQIAEIITLSEKIGRHHLHKMNCLRRCITQKKLLERRGVNTQIQIGVKIIEGQLKAHAWLTYNSVCINDSDENINTYKPITNQSSDDFLSMLV